MPTPDLAFSRAKISADGDRSGEHFDTSRRAVMRATTRALSRPPSRLRRSSVDARDDARARASSSSSSTSSEGRHRISARDASFGAGERDAGDDARAATRDDCAMMEDDARTYETDDSDGSDTVTALIERTTETEKITRDYYATEDSARERTGDANASDAMIEALEGKIKACEGASASGKGAQALYAKKAAAETAMGKLSDALTSSKRVIEIAPLWFRGYVLLSEVTLRQCCDSSSVNDVDAAKEIAKAALERALFLEPNVSKDSKFLSLCAKIGAMSAS